MSFQIMLKGTYVGGMVLLINLENYPHVLNFISSEPNWKIIMHSN